MKKVMISILILIPVLIMFIVAMVSNIVSLQAWIAVDSIELLYKNESVEAESLSYSFDDIANKTLSVFDYVDVRVYPEKAKNYVIEWQISGDVTCTDEQYQTSYEKYLKDRSALRAKLEEEFSTNGKFEDEDVQAAYNVAKVKYPDDTAKIYDEMTKMLVTEVKPAFAFVDEAGNAVKSNSTGKFVVNAFCSCEIEVVVENITKTLLVSVSGQDVKAVVIGNLSGDDENTLGIGESKRIVPKYTPIDSVVNYTVWHALDEDIATIDQNGVITAKKEGLARFQVDASVYSSEGNENIRYVSSDVYTLKVVKKGASTKYGSHFKAHQRNYSLEELGISDEFASVEGATVVDGLLSVNDDATQVIVRYADGRGDFVIDICDENEIAIENSHYYDKDSGYILAVKENSLQLNVVWASQTKQGTPTDVIWSSSDDTVATVSEDGLVKGVGDGIVTIVASCDGVETSITLNVRTKMSSLQLRTSDASLSVGFARETVFASYKYVNDDVSIGDEREINGVNIVVLGEPKRTDDMTLEQYAEALESFYKSFVFEVVSGGEYASFDETVSNRLKFNPDALEGKGKQPIRVRVKVRYPKYEGISKFTSQEVTIKAIYGVAVYNIGQLENAARYQEDYVESNEFDAVFNAAQEGREYTTPKGNIQPPVTTFEHVVEATGERYISRNDTTSLRTYAIVLMANCDYGADMDPESVPLLEDVNNRLNIFGDLYGNNNMICALKGQVDDYLIRFSWSNITISNVTLRANSIDGDGNIDADDTTAFKGHVAVVGSHHNWDRFHLTGIRFEYCIIENARQGVSARNADIEYDGCLMRNFLQCGMYLPHYMIWRDEDKAFNPYYSHVKFNNLVCSNLLGSVMSASYELYTIKGKDGNSFINRFVPNGSNEENGQYFMEHFASKGINLEITQTGFFKAYNWQNLKSANIIDTGQEVPNKIIGGVAGGIITDNPSFADYRYRDSNNEYWFHMAFIVSGVSGGNGVFDEPTYAKVSLEDTNLDCICLGDIDGNSGDGGAIVKGMFSTMRIYGYRNTAPITPFSRYTINAEFIDSLH